MLHVTCHVTSLKIHFKIIFSNFVEIKVEFPHFEMEKQSMDISKFECRKNQIKTNRKGCRVIVMSRHRQLHLPSNVFV